jgi:hypothetical protein
MMASIALAGSANGNDPMQVGAQFQAMAHSILSVIIKCFLFQIAGPLFFITLFGHEI